MDDLQPYICPFIPECIQRSRLFKNVTEWEHHLEQKHGSKTRFFQKGNEPSLWPIKDFNLDKYLKDHGDALGSER